MFNARATRAVIVSIAVTLLPFHVAFGSDVKDFYDKNDISIIIGYNPGGTYDLYARLAAKHLPRHIPGQPGIFAKYVPGVASLKAANFLYEQAPRDGSTLGVITQSIALQQVLKHPAVRYDAKEFNWIGRLTTAAELTIVWHAAPVKTIEDAKKRKVVIGVTSLRSSSATLHRLMNAIVGTKFEIVHGYKGTTGAQLAMERGEVEGSLAVGQNLLVRKAGWLKENKISVLVLYTLKRHPAFPEVPAMVELGDSPEDKEILSLYGSTAEVGRSIMAPPGVPQERLAALRAAFDAMLQDPEFREEMTTRKMEFDPLSGAELKKLVDRSFAISPGAAARAAAATRN